MILFCKKCSSVCAARLFRIFLLELHSGGSLRLALWFTLGLGHIVFDNPAFVIFNFAMGERSRVYSL
jgi:hypothetical protein